MISIRTRFFQSRSGRQAGGLSRRKSATLAVAVLSIVLTAALAGPPVAAQGPPLRIAVVNLDYIVAQSPAGKELQSKLAAFTQSVQTDSQSRADAANQIRLRMADGANSLSEDRLAELRKQYEDAQIDIRRFQDDKQREGRKMQEEGLREVEKQLEPVFKQIRDEEGYDLILNNVPGVVVMVGPRVEITQKVLDRLNPGGS